MGSFWVRLAKTGFFVHGFSDTSTATGGGLMGAWSGGVMEWVQTGSLVGKGTANVWPPQPTARIADEITNIKLMATGYTGQAVESS